MWLHVVRTVLYVALLLFALLTFILALYVTATTVIPLYYYSDYTFAGYEHLRYTYIEELIAAGLLTLVIVIPMHFFIHRRRGMALNKLWVELVALAVLWALFIGGAATLTFYFFDFSFCTTSECHAVQALEGFAWLAWITLTFLLFGLLSLGIYESAKGRSSVWNAGVDGHGWFGGSAGYQGNNPVNHPTYGQASMVDQHQGGGAMPMQSMPSGQHVGQPDGQPGTNGGVQQQHGYATGPPTSQAGQQPYFRYGEAAAQQA